MRPYGMAPKAPPPPPDWEPDEDAGRPIEALVLAAMGFRMLSMRPASIGPVKSLMMRIRLDDLRGVIDTAIADGEQTVRPAVMDYLRDLT